MYNTNESKFASEHDYVLVEHRDLAVRILETHCTRATSAKCMYSITSPPTAVGYKVPLGDGPSSDGLSIPPVFVYKHNNNMK